MMFLTPGFQSIKSLPIYINFDGKYFSLSDKKKEIYYAEYIEPNKFFSSDYISGKIKTSQNLNVLTKSFDQTSSVFLRIPEKKEIINEIVNGLQLNIQDHSAHTISISHQHTNAFFSKDVCNTLIDVYMSYDLEKKKLSSDKIVEFINIQKDSVKKRLVDSEKKLRKFKKYNKHNFEKLELKNIQNKTEQVQEELIKTEANLELLNKLDLMFRNNLSSKINISSISEPLLKNFNLDKREKELMIGTIRNRDILREAKNELKKEKIDRSYFGELLNEHQIILKKVLKISTPKIDLMLRSAQQAGAYGGKINGSGGGGCMIAYCPDNSTEIKHSIEKVGGKAHIVNMVTGTQENKEVINL